jgi:very-short-patch-repair endonuclease
MNDQRTEDSSGYGPCPSCGNDSWNDLGCLTCGLEFWPPSEAYWAASAVPVGQRVRDSITFLGSCRECGEPVTGADDCALDDDGNAVRHAWCRGTWKFVKLAAPPVPLLSRAPVLAPPLPVLPASASPIEIRFWETCCQLRLPALAGLAPEHRVAGYRIDFALPDRKIGIELDGFASHSSTADIAKDRRRQRLLEGHGWYIIRFGGSEIHRDAEGCVRQAAYLIEHARKGGPE